MTGKLKTGGNVAAAKEVGKQIAEKAKEKGIKRVVFDRGGYLYHGRIKALADACARSGTRVLTVYDRRDASSVRSLKGNNGMAIVKKKLEAGQYNLKDQVSRSIA